MNEFHYERLSAQDRTFLDLETSRAHQHVGAVVLLHAGRLRGREGGIDIERVRAYVASRLHRIPRYRQRLANIPFENHPVWVDDASFRIDDHVRHTALPHPGDLASLKRLVGRLLGQPLDRARPLWELWVVEGLDAGDRFAIVQKTHHCMIDGLAAVDLMGVLLRPEPEETFEPGPAYVPRAVPRGFDLLRAEAGRRWDGLSGVLGSAIEAGPTRARWLDEVLEGAGAIVETLGAGLAPTSSTPLNGTLGPHRAFEWLDMKLDAVRAVKQRLGGTLNDVVLAVVAGALRSYLTRRRVPLADLRLRANVPVSVRADAERGELGNRIALWMAALPVDEPDPVRRLERVCAVTESLRASRQAQGAEALAALSDWTSGALLSLAVRASTRGRPYNVVVTNVPGPRVPLYLLESRAETCYPVVNLLHEQGLGIALFSYADSLFWGFTADPEIVQDLADFPGFVEASFEVLAEAAEAR